ncbi:MULTISPECIES: GNAT family N-acetyltransferase [Planococcaceae]|uniref:GNAT family N-acetyltransferase n=1 Tax=Planococcus halotolerans TaxID=2233542 RepID=A0A365KRI0_9BACL|nr:MULTISPECIES: GNAT family N-acetyltransferase [Planococcaceae]QHJ69282.1 GNAT family N-acetyltransferase [Planococcus halotolerans]RAZ75740.1 GNAT family N-acetyltransferase [Planococcus halotolerans]RLQ90721.1 N-acetyltransferase [Planomicrobium sp. Y74]
MDFKMVELGQDEFAFRNEDNGTVNGEITWTQMADVMVVEHTFVNENMRNQGLAKKLVDRAVEYARENEYKIEPVCSYVATVFDRYDEYEDVKV